MLVKVLSYANTVDVYGQKRQDTPTESTIELDVYEYNTANVANPLYLDVDLVGLTFGQLDTSNQVVINSIKYDVKKFIPTHRRNQVFLKREK